MVKKSEDFYLFVSYLIDNNSEWGHFYPKHNFIHIKRSEFTFKNLVKTCQKFVKLEEPEKWSCVILNYKFISKEEYELMTASEPPSDNKTLI